MTTMRKSPLLPLFDLVGALASAALAYAFRSIDLAMTLFASLSAIMAILAWEDWTVYRRERQRARGQRARGQRAPFTTVDGDRSGRQ